MISAYETGKRDVPIFVLVKYSEKFQVSTDWILQGFVEKHSESGGKAKSAIFGFHGGYFEGSEIKTLTRVDNKIVVEREFYNGSHDDGRPLYEDMKWANLLENLSYVHMEEWKTKYDDPDILDGIQWSVDIKYDNGIPTKHYWGSNKFPYNFERFLELMEMV